MGEMRERMLRGELYIADDPESEVEFNRVQELLARFNSATPAAWDERDALLRQMLRHVGEGVVVRPRFYREYGASGCPGADPPRDRRRRSRRASATLTRPSLVKA